jgi:hypothetical protein
LAAIVTTLFNSDYIATPKNIEIVYRKMVKNKTHSGICELVRNLKLNVKLKINLSKKIAYELLSNYLIQERYNYITLGMYPTPELAMINKLEVSLNFAPNYNAMYENDICIIQTNLIKKMVLFELDKKFNNLMFEYRKSTTCYFMMNNSRKKQFYSELMALNNDNLDTFKEFVINYSNLRNYLFGKLFVKLWLSNELILDIQKFESMVYNILTIHRKVCETDKIIECPVCYETTEIKNQLTTNCKHIFCKKCVNTIKQQLDATGVNKYISCPLCRKNIYCVKIII